VASQGPRRSSAKGGKNQAVRASPTMPGGTRGARGASNAPRGPGSGAGPAPVGQRAGTAPKAAGGQAGRAGRGSAGTRPGRAAGTAAQPGAGTTAVPPTGIRRVLHAIWAPVTALGAVRLIIWVLSLFGLGASTWLTITHFDTHIVLACPDTGLINCAKVTSSPQSEVFGAIPVAVLGLAFYVFMAVVNSPWFWAMTSRWQPRLRQLAARVRLGSVIVGMCFVLYLIYAELIQIRNICLWCTSVHVTTFLIFTLLVFYTAFSGSRDDYGANLTA
jgi:uncharacterized membrane protein